MRIAAAVLAALALAPAAGAAPLVVRTSLDPGTVPFGAPTAAEVTVVVDTGAVDPDTVRVEADTAPLRRVGATATEREDGDGTRLLVRRLRVACVTDACRPADALRAVALQPVRVRATRRDGRPITVRASWPVLLVAPRVPAGAASGEPVWRVDTRPPEATYRVRPSLLSGLLLALAAALATAAVGLVAWEARGRRRRRTHARRSELEAALAALRASLDADERERRRAAGTLARVLESRRDRHGGDAAALAWGEPEPRPDRLAALADEVEREIHA
ncbi:MAG: hypothetical protein ACM33B_02260 [Pseudomonadota bacterium]